MHESAITQSMVDLVSKEGENVGAKRVGRINLVIGKMSGVVDESVQFYFDFMSKGTILEGAALSFQMIPATARCSNCGKEFELKEFDWACPDCGHSGLEVIAGDELRVESIEVE